MRRSKDKASKANKDLQKEKAKSLDSSEAKRGGKHDMVSPTPAESILPSDTNSQIAHDQESIRQWGLDGNLWRRKTQPADFENEIGESRFPEYEDDGTFDSPNMPKPPPSYRIVTSNSPIGSTTGSPQRTDDGRCPGAIKIQDAVRPPDQPKPIPMEEWKKYLPGILREANDLTNEQVLQNIKMAHKALEKKKAELDFWTSESGQKELERRVEANAKPPRTANPARPGRWRTSVNDAMYSTSSALSPLDYTEASRAHLSPVGPASEEWFEIELTADSGACDTVIPKGLCPGIPIMPSFQSLHNMAYEVANGESIPNLGERRCMMWTEGASQPNNISMQVADVHKALLSLSRCADMGFESHFGSQYGCLIDTETSEVIPLVRKGNLYVLRAWIRAAPFGRQEER